MKVKLFIYTITKYIQLKNKSNLFIWKSFIGSSAGRSSSHFCRSIELSFLQVDQALKFAGRSSLIKLSVGILSYTEGTSPKWCCQWSFACKSQYGWFLNIMNKFVLYQASSAVFLILGVVWKRSQCASIKHSVELQPLSVTFDYAS